MMGRKGRVTPFVAGLGAFLVVTTSGVADVKSEPSVGSPGGSPVFVPVRAELPGDRPQAPDLAKLERDALSRAAETHVVDYETWHGTSFGAFLAPKGDFWGDDGGVDVIVHFNAAMLAGRSWQQSHANAVVVSASFGAFGSGPYQEAMADPGRFGRMISEVIAGVSAQKKHPGLHVRRVGIVAWSAGFGAVGRVLSVPKYFAQVDSVILLDAMQAGYKDPSRGMGQGPDRVSLTGIDPYVRFAQEAKAGKKQLVITHTSIIPPEYASTTDAALALVAAVSAEKHPAENGGHEANSRGMLRTYRVDTGDLHVHGYRGAGPDDHMKHLHMVGDVVREWLVPRWSSPQSSRTPSIFAQAVSH
jgi:hypothetical protein